MTIVLTRQITVDRVLAPRIVERNNDTELATLLALEAQYLNREEKGHIEDLIASSLREILSVPYFRTVLSGHQAPVTSVAFSPDGQTLASGSEDGTVRLQISPIDTLVDLARQKVRRNLSQADWARYLLSEDYRQTCPNLPPSPRESSTTGKTTGSTVTPSERGDLGGEWQQGNDTMP